MAGGAFSLTVFFISSYFLFLNWRDNQPRLNPILVIASLGISLGALLGAIIGKTKIPPKPATVFLFFSGGVIIALFVSFLLPYLFLPFFGFNIHHRFLFAEIRVWALLVLIPFFGIIGVLFGISKTLDEA